MREVLVRQNKSQEIAGQRAKLQQQLDTLTANVASHPERNHGATAGRF